MGKHVVGSTGDIKAGERKIVRLEGISIGVFNIKGTYYAVKNSCPHQLAPLCLGKVTGTTLPSKPGEFLYGKEGEVVRCPWHGWEFDLTNGQSLFDPNKCRVKTYEVGVEAPGEEEPRLETFPVDVEEEQVVVTINR
ncbi:Rieske (2Fe-2S) protein [Paenibacillus doosanensis]|uniref:Naphthalene 1,2-dioxygenase/salicylate 5-hydroxylase systems, ferredoxin component n=1 Tax=Paenibacillus konkukensis TaxID=2020716 RepID=A0ABY4RV73_9BACL|nr:MULTISPECIES: Rieske (2Fe-2S) protein [Paenibacillus]MCS7460306.1 Rieske (2Fe-2S) protein [Paenibacillus doosanensis]UQZ86148.1 Naphthalene 1,2-dioxygenase/salicylate 5-hydroxylase systems, ferredoxin component [Paenibacillus konkukensis]